MWNSTHSPWRRTWRGHNERGVALPGVLLLAAFLVGVTGWLAGHVRTDVGMRTANEEALLGRRLAESALQSAAMALGQQPDWVQIDTYGCIMRAARRVNHRLHAGLNGPIPTPSQATRAPQTRAARTHAA